MKNLMFLLLFLLITSCSNNHNSENNSKSMSREERLTNATKGPQITEDSLFLMRIIDGSFFTQRISEEKDYVLVVRYCLAHTDEQYDETFSEGLGLMLRKYPEKIVGLQKAMEQLSPKQQETANYNMIFYLASSWLMDQYEDADSIDLKTFYNAYPFLEKNSEIDKILEEQAENYIH